MSISVLSPIKVNSGFKADRIDPDSHGGGTVSKATVLTGVRAPIAVQRETADGGMQVVGTTEVISKSEGASPSFETTPARVYADTQLLERAVENGVGVATAPRTTAVLDAQAATSQPPVVVQAPPSTTVTTQLVKTTPTIASAVVSTPKVRVAISNKNMGKHRVTVRNIAISSSVIILAYPADSDTIIEPPICGTDEPVRIDYAGESYFCVSAGWTAELEGMFLVILPRTEAPLQ
jgi:hypothetical protein